MNVGRVEYYNQERGLGYLSHHKNSEDILFTKEGYCHISADNNTVEADQTVFFAPATLPDKILTGEWVLFEKRICDSGFYAAQWGFASQNPEFTKYIGYEIEMSYRLAKPTCSYYRIRFRTKKGNIATFWLGNRADLAISLNRDSREYGDTWWLEVKDSPQPWQKIAIEDVPLED